MNKDIIVIENFIPEYYQKSIEEIFSNNFPWHFSKNTSGVEEGIPTFGLNSKIDKNNQYGFSHIMLEENQIFSNSIYLLNPMIYKISEFIGESADIFRVRAGMTVSNMEHVVVSGHVDYKFPHTTALYYVNDSDGDTIFYKELYDQHVPKSLNFLESHSPKRGSLVMFNGLRYHSTTKPKNNPFRITININMTNTIF